jgi:paraquat-inducible protein B
MNRSNPKVIGAFVVGALALAVVAIAAVGSGRLFSKHYKYVLFFPGDVSGLRVGADVRFRGVPIGSVRAIRLNIEGTPSTLLANTSEEPRIPVIIELDQTQIALRGGRFDLASAQKLQDAVNNGLRGQLRLDSLLTGLSYVSLDMIPNAPLVLYLPQGSRYQEIPTVKATLEQARGTLERLIAKMDEADLPGMMTAASSAMKGFEQLVTSPGLHAAVESLNGTEQHLSSSAQEIGRTAVRFRVLADNVNSGVSPLMSTLQGASQKARDTMTSADQTMVALRTTTEPASPLIYRMNKTLDDVSNAANAIQELADYLKRNPSAILRGRYADNK